jgi:hypothetical protein
MEPGKDNKMITTYLKIDPRMFLKVDDGIFPVLEIDRDFLDGCGVEDAKDFSDEEMKDFSQRLYDGLADNGLSDIIKVVGEMFNEERSL